VHWGQTDCEGRDMELVYSGFMAGPSKEGRDKTAVNKYLCMPNFPTYSKFDQGKQSRYSQIYRVEYAVDRRSDILDTSAANRDGVRQKKDFNGNTVPCAVCLYFRSTAKVTIPGNNQCPSGWREAYSGYLMANIPAQENYGRKKREARKNKRQTFGQSADPPPGMEDPIPTPSFPEFPTPPPPSESTVPPLPPSPPPTGFPPFPPTETPQTNPPPWFPPAPPTTTQRPIDPAYALMCGTWYDYWQSMQQMQGYSGYSGASYPSYSYPSYPSYPSYGSQSYGQFAMPTDASGQPSMIGVPAGAGDPLSPGDVGDFGSSGPNPSNYGTGPEPPNYGSSSDYGNQYSYDDYGSQPAFGQQTASRQPGWRQQAAIQAAALRRDRFIRDCAIYYEAAEKMRRLFGNRPSAFGGGNNNGNGDQAEQNEDKEEELVTTTYGQNIKTNFVCMNRKPEVHALGKINSGISAKIAPVEVSCNDLPCPNYRQGRELQCVVCVK